MKNEIQEKLEQLAFDRTTPFCYGCNIKAPKGVCPHCHSGLFSVHGGKHCF